MAHEKKFQNGNPYKQIIFFHEAVLFFLCVVITLYLPKTLKSFKSEGIYKDAGVWIKTFYPDVPAVLTDDAIIAFYAGVQRLEIPKTNTYKKLITYARTKKINLIAVTDDIVDYVPDFFSKINHRDLRELYRVTSKKEKVVIYQVIDEQQSKAKLHADE